MMNVDVAAGRPPLVLIVDPSVSSRHFMWRALSRALGVLEAGSADAARAWITQRPDIDAIVVQDELPDQRGLDLVRDLHIERRAVASRAIVLARPQLAGQGTSHGPTLLDRGDLPGVLRKLASWFLVRDAELARALSREAGRLAK